MKVPVIHIITMLELGGAQQNTLYTLASLDRSKYRPVLIAGEGGPLVQDALSLEGVETHFVSELVREIRPLTDLAALFNIYGLIRGIVKNSGNAPVIVHTHSSKAGILGRVAAYLAGARIIVHTVHGFGFNDRQGRLKRGLLVAAERLAAVITGRFVAVASDNIDKGVKERILTRGNSEVVRSGIDIGRFSSPPEDVNAVRAGMGVPPDAPVVSMISCLKPQKAPVDFVRVAASVLRKSPDAHFVQAGDGELRNAMLDEANRLGVADRLHLLGWRRDVGDIIHASDVVVLTSLWEGLPRVVPQAMAAGKPVVATAVDGTPEAVKDGVTGFLASPHDVEYMAGKVALLLSDKALAVKMGEAAKKGVAEFGQDEMVRRIERLYDKLLKEKA